MGRLEAVTRVSEMRQQSHSDRVNIHIGAVKKMR